MNKLYPNSTSEGQNDCAFPRYLLYFHGAFYTVWQKEARQITYQVIEAMREAEET